MKLSSLALSTFALLVTAPVAADEPCPAGTEAGADGACKPKVDINCPAGTIFEAGKGCVAKVVECPPGQILEANKCVPKPAPPPPTPAPTPPLAETKKPEEPPAPPGPPKRFMLGLRVGFMLPLLNIYRDSLDNSPTRLSNQVDGALPIGLELTYRVIDPLAVGAVFSFGPAFARKASDGSCSPSADSCTGDHLRVALQARLYPLRGHAFDPWVGLAFGYERLTLREEGTLGTGKTGGTTMMLSGLEFFELSVGGDLTVLPDLRVGPFLSFALGQYGSVSVKEDTGAGIITTNDSVKNPSPHGWLQLGVRGAFGLF